MNRQSVVVRAMKLKTWLLAAGVAMLIVAIATMSGAAQTETQYPPLSEYLMAQNAEIALARSAAPATISGQCHDQGAPPPSGYDVVSPKATTASSVWSCVAGRRRPIRRSQPCDLVYDPRDSRADLLRPGSRADR